MYSSIILDFVGVIADINFKKLIKDLPIKQKFSGLRIFLTLKKQPKAKNAFNDYQKGIISSEELEQAVAEFCPKSAYVVPIILQNISNYTYVNEDVLDVAEILRDKGIKIIVMSNTIPETEKIMQDFEIEDCFDGVISSCKLQMKKPTPDIYQYAIDTYNLNPETTLMIDDTEKNLIGAEKFNIKTARCKSTKETYDLLTNLLMEIDKLERIENYINNQN